MNDAFVDPIEEEPAEDLEETTASSPDPAEDVQSGLSSEHHPSSEYSEDGSDLSDPEASPADETNESDSGPPRSTEDETQPPLSEPSSPAEEGAHVGDRFRRLLIGGPVEEGDQEPSQDRHPTGTPEKTGGWYAESVDAQLGQDPTRIQRRSVRIPGAPRTEDDTPINPRTPVESNALPRRVTERDLGATQVSPVAFARPSRSPAPPKRSFLKRLWGLGGYGGCLLRMGILALFAAIALLIAIASFALYQYSLIAASLPSVEDLQARAAQFETTRILDREGNLLYEILDPQAGRRTYVPMQKISPYMVAATVATEDSLFYTHPGFDPWAIVRAFVQNFQQGEIVSGSSTITQQIARNLVLDPEERSQRTALRKIREILLAEEITRRYTKDEILELYLNQSYFGNLAYGVEAAAETYFATTADKLTLSQSAFLAGLVQAPSVYDIFTNRVATLNRTEQVLGLMVQASAEQGCIYVSNNPQPICVSPEEAGAASAEMIDYNFTPTSFNIRFPHWVTYIRSELEQLFDPQTIYRSGFTVYTTLDPDLQEQAQKIVADQVANLAEHQTSDGALVAIRPSTGEILAMVGSADFYNEEIDGQVNMAIQPRQPGSSIKPITYTAAFEKGWTPATLIWDVPSEFPPSGNPNDTREPYKPVNYDRRFHGPVTVRTALANSYNIPAVKALNFIGVYDNPLTPEEDGFISMARRMGITTLNRDDYGLALTLGGGAVTLLEMTGVYSIFADEGMQVPPFSISRIVDHNGDVAYEYEIPPAQRVIRAEHAYLISSILSDNNARTPAMGANSALNLPFQAAAKTGTSEDYKDAWTLGYTPDLAVGVWIGNADNSDMQNLSGLRGAAPIWSEFMQYAIGRLTGGFPTPFERPPGITEVAVCTTSGAQPSEWCPSHRIEVFASDQPPLPKQEDLWQNVWIDSWTRQLASADCPDYAVETFAMNVTDPWAKKWLEDTKDGQAWAEKVGFPDDKLFFVPTESCGAESPRPIIFLSAPAEGSTVEASPIEISGKAAATGDFKDWVLQYGFGFDPQSWTRIKFSDTAEPEVTKLLDWEPEENISGAVTVRLIVRGTNGGSAEERLHFNLHLPTPTPTITPTSTITPTATQTATPTPSNSPTPSNTPTSSATPSATSTPTPSATPTP